METRSPAPKFGRGRSFQCTHLVADPCGPAQNVPSRRPTKKMASASGKGALSPFPVSWAPAQTGHTIDDAASAAGTSCGWCLRTCGSREGRLGMVPPLRSVYHTSCLRAPSKRRVSRPRACLLTHKLLKEIAERITKNACQLDVERVGQVVVCPFELTKSMPVPCPLSKSQVADDLHTLITVRPCSLFLTH